MWLSQVVFLTVYPYNPRTILDLDSHEVDSRYETLTGAIERAGEGVGILRRGGVSGGTKANFHQPWYNLECRSSKYMIQKSYRKYNRNGYPTELLRIYLVNKRSYNEFKKKRTADTLL